MSFTLKEKKDGSLCLVMPYWFRLLFLFIAVLLISGIITSGLGAGGQWIPILIIGVCIWGSLYEEKWIFNKQENIIIYLTGIVFLNKKSVFKFENIETFKISGDFHTNNEGRFSRLRKKMVKYSLILNSGKVFDIDICTRKTECSELKEKAEKIASYCGIQLTVNS
jgi:hypothetical protein